MAVFMIFMVYIFFFDAHDMISQIGIKYKLHQIKNQMKYLESQTQDAQDQIEELTTNKSSLEKFAREQYRMKRENEEIFVVVPEKD